jgi:CheY-like chemotaxis protein
MRGRRILVVDDEETIARVMQRALFGYEVTSATTGRGGLDRIRGGEHFDAVICDVHMPGMDGIEFAAELALIAPDLAKKILFVTGDPQVVEMLSGRSVLAMPFETHTLRCRLEQVLHDELGY